MSSGEIIQIASFAISLAVIIFAVGKNTQRLQVAEKDVNNLGAKLDAKVEQINLELRSFDKRADNQSVFMVRVDGRVRQIQEALLGEDRTERLRETVREDPHYRVNQEDWHSENSGIDL